MRKLSWAAIALALAACTQPRKLVLSIDTNAGVPCDIDRVALKATAGGITMFEQSLDGAHLPAFVTLLDATPSGSFNLEITGLRGGTAVMKVTGPLQFSGKEETQPVMLDLACPVDQPCPLAGAMAGSGAVTRFQCGPEVDRYGGTVTPETFVDACTVPGRITGSVLMDNSAVPAELTLLTPALPGFDFQFYGQPIHKIWASRDGYISFSRDNPDPQHVLVPGPFDRGIKGTGAPPPEQSVMGFWDTLTLGNSGVCYELEGSPGGQLIRVTWSHACLTQPPCVSGGINFTITLDESTRRVVTAYSIPGTSDREKGATATVGLVNQATGCPADQCSIDTGQCSGGTMPCGYSQLFSNTVQTAGIKNEQFSAISN